MGCNYYIVYSLFRDVHLPDVDMFVCLFVFFAELPDVSHFCHAGDFLDDVYRMLYYLELMMKFSNSTS